MQIKYYTVSPGCTSGDGSKLFLTVGSAGNVIVDKQSTTDGDSQLWALIPHFNPGGLCIVSKSPSDDGEMVAIDAPSNQAAVRLAPLNALVRGTWNVLDNGAIQLHVDPSMNLNVNGSQPINAGSAVLAWIWGSGPSSNEVWTFTPSGQVASLSEVVVQA